MEQTVVRADLTPYVPRIACTWERETPERTWQVVDGSLVFADISGFTALSERLAKRGPIGAEELTDVLGGCFAGLLAIAYAEGGSLLKFGGDALLLLFDGPGHELRAARSALGMRSAIRTIGRLTTSVGSVRLRMSQGVHSGAIHLFRVGESHKELIVCGPAATEVVRMESTADAGEVVVSGATAAALRRLAPAVVGTAKGPGTLLRANTIVHLVEGAYPASIPDRDAAAAGVPVALREFLATGGGDSEHRHVAIAFVHFDGVDALIGRDGPGACASALDALAVLTQSVATDEGVTFLATDADKDGGKIILVAGAPAATEDAEGRLLRSVRRIVDATNALGGPLTVRAGVNRGHVFAGAVGPPYRRTYTVMGDSVNLAARLMAKARAGEVVVAPSVLELSRTAYDTLPLTPFAVKGKTAPVTAILLGRSDGVQEPRRQGRTPLVGRRAELARLREAASAASIIDVVGDVGVGKTRLLHELRAAFDGEMRIVTCEQYERTTPYFAFRVLLRHLLGSPESESDLRDAVVAVAADLEPWVPLVADVVQVAADETDATRKLEPEYRRQLTVRTIERLLAAVADGNVLAFDDAQWMDDASSEVLRALVTASSAGDASCTICIARRPDDHGFVPAHGDVVEVGPLADDDARALVYAACGDRELTPHRAATIVRLTQGNPLFIEELVRMPHDADHLPTTLDAVIASQIDALDPVTRRLLRHAAVLGDSFEPALFAAVVNQPALADGERLSGRLQGMVVPTGDGRVAFRHRIIRDVAYRGLPFRDRHALHARAAHVIEQQSGERSGDRAEVLSMHCFHAQQYEKCWTYALIAADRAREKYALVEANELYERAIAAARRIPEIDATEVITAWRMLAKVLDAEGSVQAAATALARARRLARDVPNVLQAILCGDHAQVALRMGRHTAAARWILRGVRLVEDDTSDAARFEHAHLLVLHAWVRLQSGRPKDALRVASAAIETAAQADDKRVAGLAHEVAEAAVMALGGAGAGSHGVLAAELFEEVGEDAKLARILNLLGAIAYFEGRWSDALDLYARSAEKLQAIGCVLEAAAAQCNTAEIFSDQGRLDEARARLLEATTTWRAMRFDVGVAFATRHLGRVALRSGEVDLALEHFESARAVLETHGLRAKVLEVDTWIADCRLRLGDGAAARELLLSVLAEERSSGSFEMRAMVHRLLACAAAADGDLPTAWAELDESLEVARQRNLPFETALGLEAMAALVTLGSFRTVDRSITAERDEIVAALGIAALPALPLTPVH